MLTYVSSLFMKLNSCGRNLPINHQNNVLLIRIDSHPKSGHYLQK